VGVKLEASDAIEGVVVVLVAVIVVAANETMCPKDGEKVVAPVLVVAPLKAGPLIAPGACVILEDASATEGVASEAS
jgi:hypothetical protein